MGAIVLENGERNCHRASGFYQRRVQDQLSAYTVFETLNVRGLELTETDLLKNHLTR